MTPPAPDDPSSRPERRRHPARAQTPPTRRGASAAVTVHIVDDDPAVRRALSLILRLHGQPVREHASAQSFLADPTAAHAGCVVLDLSMPGMSGLALQAALQERGIDVEIVFLTAHGDVPTVAAAMKRGAGDFLEKPARKDELLRAVDGALQRSAEHREERAVRADARRRLALLTPREREVCALVASGVRGPRIAEQLGICNQTVKVHRHRALTKLGAMTVADVVRVWRAATAADEGRDGT
jgi:FixJ family two-component response regulator